MRRLAAALSPETHSIRVAATRVLPFITLIAVLFAALYLPPSARTDQPSYDTVGPIEGEAISVQGPLNIEVVQGRTVLKSVNLLTVALDTGIIHAYIEGPQPALTVYTAQLQAKPFAISGAPLDTLVGFDPTGAMCIRADSGAVRVEQQLTAQSIVVPQSGEVLITNGQLESLRSGVTHCSCALQLAKTQTRIPPSTEVSRLPTPEEMQKANTDAAKLKTQAAKAPAVAAPKPAATDGPVYQVFMPPLSYDAGAKVQPDNFDPQLIVLVRRVRVRPTLIFQGSVKDAPAIAENTSPTDPAKSVETPASQSQQTQQKNPQTSNSVIARIRAFFRSLFS